jgi:hypothetical protein
MFIKITPVIFSPVVLNSDYIVEMKEGVSTVNGREHKVVRITMSDGEKHEATEKLPIILKALAGIPK